MSGSVILVPLDGSDQALSALPVAIVLGKIKQAALHILYVGEHELAGEELHNRLGLGAFALDGATFEARVGIAAAKILQVAEEIEPHLIVLCRQGGVERGKVLGRTAMKVLANASCPVVLVPPERGATPWHFHHVLVPHDGTPTTSAALKPAAELAQAGHAELLVAHVTGISAAATEPGSLATPAYVDQPQHEWPAWSSEFVKRLESVCPLGHLHPRIFLAQGDAAAEILRLSESQSADLIVLAWRGRWEAPRAPILKHVLGEAHCPIMVVRARGRSKS